MSHEYFEQCLNSFPLEVAAIREEPVYHLASLFELSRAFQKVTGYHLRFFKPNAGTKTGTIDCVATFPIVSGERDASCVMGLVRNFPAVSLIPERDVEYLARALADMISESQQWQVALRQREAELAANVQLTFHDREYRGLARQLEQLLRGGAKAVHGDAAALYLLDHETSFLKLRSIWGLPEERLTDPPRPLKTAFGDLEAMLGHAVVLKDDARLAERWNVPENFSSSLCVPVTSATTIHGTLWCFADSPEAFDGRAIPLLEIVAGRIALELEHQTLLREGHDGMILKRQLTDAEHFLQNQLPRAVVGSRDSWQIAGALSHSKPLAATFYHWQDITPDKSLFTIVSTAETMPSVEAQMRMVMLQAEIKNLGHYKCSAGRVIRELEDIAFSQHAEKKPFEMLYGLIDKSKSQLRIACGGSFVLFQCQADHHGKLADIRRIDDRFRDAKPEVGGFRMLRMAPGDCLVAVHLSDDSCYRNHRLLDALYPRSFLREKVMPAVDGRNKGGASRIAELFATQTQETVTGANVTILVVKRS